MKPPKDLDGADLFQALLEAAQPSDVVDYPRAGPDGHPIGKVRIMLLRQEDHDRARTEAQHYVLSLLKSVQDKSMRDTMFSSDGMTAILGDATARSLLARACRTVEPIAKTDGKDAKDYGLIFPDGAALKKLPATEVARLFNLYLMVQHKFGGIEANIGDDDVESWVDLLMEGGEAYPLERLPLETLAELCLRLALQVSDLRAQGSPSSSGSPSGTSSPSTSTHGSPASASSSDGSDEDHEGLSFDEDDGGIDLSEVEGMSLTDVQQRAYPLIKKD